MPAQPLGVDPNRVDTTQQYALGYEIGDPRGGIFSGNQIKYCQANGTIAAGDAVKIDVTATAANRRGVVIQTAAATAQVVEGISNVALTANQFGWITTLGYFANANVVSGTAAGAILATSGVTAGRLVVSPGAAADANAQSAGRRLLGLTLASGSNQADVLVGG